MELWNLNDEKTCQKSVIQCKKHNILSSKMMFTINSLPTGQPVVNDRGLAEPGRAAWRLISAVVVVLPKTGGTARCPFQLQPRHYLSHGLTLCSRSSLFWERVTPNCLSLAAAFQINTSLFVFHRLISARKQIPEESPCGCENSTSTSSMC